MGEKDHEEALKVQCWIWDCTANEWRNGGSIRGSKQQEKQNNNTLSTVLLCKLKEALPFNP